MTLLKLRAKVDITSEEAMEVEQTYDLGNIATNKNWVWAFIGVPVEEVYRVISYNDRKTIVIMNGGEKILVMGAFDTIFEQWGTAKKEYEAMAYDLGEDDPDADPEETKDNPGPADDEED